jgi:trigger factor
VHPFDHDEAKFEEFLVSQGSTREQFDTETKEAAEKSVRTRLVLDALADREQTTVSEQELTERIVFQAQQYQMQPEEFVRRIQEAGQLGAVYSDVRRSKALISAVRAATVTDASGNEVDMSDLLGGDEDEGAETTDAPEASEDAPATSEEKATASS